MSTTNTTTKKVSPASVARAHMLSIITESLKANGYDVLVTGANEVSIPYVSTDGVELYVVLSPRVPKGEKDGKGGFIPYDGFLAAEEYEQKQAQTADKPKRGRPKKGESAATETPASENELPEMDEMQIV